jgi:PIN domain nuclease of toxin-antitoxin system
VPLLLDTHALLWWLRGDRTLGATARAAIADEESLVFMSAASALEVAIKRAHGKLEAPGDVERWAADEGFEELPITAGHAVASADLPVHHRDPFDRLLIAQARLEGLTLVTADAAIRAYDVATLDATT